MHRALRRLGVDAIHVAGKAIAEQHSRNSSRKSGFLQAAKQQPTPFTPELTETIKQDIEQSSYDALLAFHASTVVPSLKIECPLIYVTDATAALLNGYYPQRQKLPQHEIEQLQKCEETTIAKSDAILVPSQWAADSVLQDYGAEPSRVHTLEWGGNFDLMPPRTSERPTRVKQKSSPGQKVSFLFVGLDWYRKGGDIAIEMVELLRSTGIEAELTVVGASIPRKNRSSFVRSVGMLNRANREESDQLDLLFQTADFYIHPARAECYGHVLCEALGFGVPVIATQTGGISQCVIDGETGVLLPPNSEAGDFAERVRELLANRPLLDEMRTSAVEDFRRRLNWDRWAPRVHKIMQELLSPTATTTSE